MALEVEVDKEPVDNSASEEPTKAGGESDAEKIPANGDGSAPKPEASSAEPVQAPAPEAAAQAAPTAAPQAAPPPAPASQKSASDKPKHKLLTRVFGIDTRSFAVFRVLLGLSMFTQIYVRWPDMQSMYSDVGCCPRVLTWQLSPAPEWWSVHFMNGSANLMPIMYGITAILGIMYMLGYRTRIVSILSFIMMISLQNRNPMIIDGQDNVQRLMLFYAMFMPLGDYYSFDRLLAKRQDKPHPRKIYINLLSFAYLSQVALIYFLTAYLKSDPAWRVDGSAGLKSLNIDFVTTLAGRFLVNYPEFLRPMTFLCVLWEGFGPFFAFSPNWIIRSIATTLFMGMHLGLLVIFKVGFFPFYNWISWVPFYPPEFWDRVGNGLNRLSFYHWCKAKLVQFAHFLDYLFPRGPRPLFDPAWLGPIREVWINFVGISAITICFLWNMYIMPKDLYPFPGQQYQMDRWMQRIVLYFRIDQTWHMFAHFLPQLNGWYVIDAHLKNGKVIDMYNGGQPLSSDMSTWPAFNEDPKTWKRPFEVSATYSNYCWRIYMVELWNAYYIAYRTDYVRWLVWEWNRTHPPDQAIASLVVYYMYEGPMPEVNPEDRGEGTTGRYPERLTVADYIAPPPQQ